MAPRWRTGRTAFRPAGHIDTATYELPAGHYRVVWQVTDAQNEKHKTFWVDDDCMADEPEDQPSR